LTARQLKCSSQYVAFKTATIGVAKQFSFVQDTCPQVMPPDISKKDWKKIKKAASKLKCVGFFLAIGLIEINTGTVK
jgi:hypothetical protein